MDIIWHPRTEPALIGEEWRALLSFDPARARRRYCHQVRLITLGQPELRASVAEFQRLAQRHPDQFLTQAYALAHQCIEPTTAPEQAQEDQWLWRQITTQPYESDNRYTDFAGPKVLIRSAIKDFAFLSSQAGYWRMSLPTRPDRQRSSTQHDAKGRARVRVAWHDAVWMLAVAVEEAQLPDALPTLRSALQERSVLAPYPDEADWRALVATDRSSAIRRLRDLHLEEAKIGISQCFNLGESIAACQAVLAEQETPN